MTFVLESLYWGRHMCPCLIPALKRGGSGEKEEVIFPHAKLDFASWSPLSVAGKGGWWGLLQCPSVTQHGHVCHAADRAHHGASSSTAVKARWGSCTYTQGGIVPSHHTKHIEVFFLCLNHLWGKGDVSNIGSCPRQRVILMQLFT